MTPEDLFVASAHELGLTPVELLERYFRHFALFLDAWTFDDKSAEERALCTEARLHAQEAARALRLLHLLERGELVQLEDELAIRHARQEKSPGSVTSEAEGNTTDRHSDVRIAASNLRHGRPGRQ